MELKNFTYLTDSLTKLGFEGVFDKPLKAAMELGQPEFVLKADLAGKDEAMLFAFKFAQNGGEYYFLNNVVTTLTKKDMEPLTHDFFLYKQQVFERGNEGRYKEVGVQVAHDDIGQVSIAATSWPRHVKKTNRRATTIVP